MVTKMVVKDNIAVSNVKKLLITSKANINQGNTSLSIQYLQWNWDLNKRTMRWSLTWENKPTVKLIIWTNLQVLNCQKMRHTS